MLTVFLLYRPHPTVHQVLYSDSFRKQVQGKAAFVLDTPEMRRVRETQRIISGVRFWNCLLNRCTLRFSRSSHVLTAVVICALQVRYHEDFEKSKGSFTPTTSDPVTERVKKNTQDFSDINYRGIQRRVVEMERRRAIEHDQETITGTVTAHPVISVTHRCHVGVLALRVCFEGIPRFLKDLSLSSDLRVWRTNPGSVFDYDPAEDNIQSRSLHMMSGEMRNSKRSLYSSLFSSTRDRQISQ